MKRSLTLLNMVALLALAAACAKAPEDDINAAKAEMDRAKASQADTWAPTEYKAAEEAMNAAQAEITAQNDKWVKDYDKAKELLARAKEEAGKASEAAVASKEQAKKDADAAISAADTALKTAEAALKVAPQTKDSKADLALFKGDLATLSTTLDGARQAFSSGDYKKALESATTVKDKATSIADQLEEAKKKRSAHATKAAPTRKR
ncbi:MAG TPA: hypothetical protein VJ144_08765 [Candidatus Polarisedimenticolia bacterium]|nr:hypothetical protein [Candidatus Polarisedimenticolia bacterium]